MHIVLHTYDSRRVLTQDGEVVLNTDNDYEVIEHLMSLLASLNQEVSIEEIDYLDGTHEDPDAEWHKLTED